jgi:hypothetical protein
MNEVRGRKTNEEWTGAMLLSTSEEAGLPRWGCEGDVGRDVVTNIVMTVAITTNMSTIPLHTASCIRNT